MTRKEAKELFRNDKDSYGKPRAIMSKIDKIFDEFKKESLTIPDIRNKLSPITHLIALLEERDGYEKEIYECKKSINYLAQRKVYKEPEHPMYVRLLGIEMCYDFSNNEYYRNAGNWSVGFIVKDGKYYSDIPHVDNVHNQELIPITRKEWEKGNKGYI